MPKHMGGEAVEIVLVAQKSDVPPMARVKGLLKAALRTWGLRCVSVRDVTPYPGGTPAAKPGFAGGAVATPGSSADPDAA